MDANINLPLEASYLSAILAGCPTGTVVTSERYMNQLVLCDDSYIDPETGHRKEENIKK
jgi:hypothetical protein